MCLIELRAECIINLAKMLFIINKHRILQKSAALCKLSFYVALVTRVLKIGKLSLYTKTETLTHIASKRAERQSDIKQFNYMKKHCLSLMTFEFNLSRQERASPVEDFKKRFSRQTGTVVILCDKSAPRDQGCVF